MAYTQDGLITALGDATKVQHRRAYFVSATTNGAGFPQDLFLSNGQPGAASTPPNPPGAIPTNSTTGALKKNNPTAPDLQNLAQFDAWSSQIGMVVLYDRLYHCNNLNGTVITAQNVDPTPTNPVNRGPGVGGISGNVGDDVEMWVEWYIATGATQKTVTVTYTDNLGNTGHISPAVNFQVSPVAGQMQQLPLQAGDSGVRSVQTLTLSGSTGGIGNFGITLLRRIAEIPIITANVGNELDYIDIGLPRIYDSACLTCLFVPSGSSTGDVRISFVLANITP